MTDKQTRPYKDKQADSEDGGDERAKNAANRKPPGPAKNVGDDTANPLPDDPSERGGKGGDAGRSS